MTTNCLNCNATLQGNYCSNCGQSAGTHKINIYFLWHDIQHGLLHLDKGILFTVKELFTNPGQSIRQYIEGKRVRHFKPLSLVLVLAGIYGFLSHYFQINMLANNIEVTGSGENFDQVKHAIEKTTEWISQHYSVLALFQIPIFALGTYLFFIKTGYNFTEHLVINAFLTGQRLMLRLITFPIYYIFNGIPELRTTERVIDIAGYLIMAWSLYQLFNSFGKGQRVMRIILSFLISFIIMFLIFTAVFEYVVSSVS